MASEVSEMRDQVENADYLTCLSLIKNSEKRQQDVAEHCVKALQRDLVSRQSAVEKQRHLLDEKNKEKMQRLQDAQTRRMAAANKNSVFIYMAGCLVMFLICLLVYYLGNLIFKSPKDPSLLQAIAIGFLKFIVGLVALIVVPVLCFQVGPEIAHRKAHHPRLKAALAAFEGDKQRIDADFAQTLHSLQRQVEFADGEYEAVVKAKNAVDEIKSRLSGHDTKQM